ncbi:RagB/SusD family nutrient uptake outer membrane protein [Mucilaginibacter ginsenosidivorax]|uniref:RagB/SusD family nutrient uptake outer membrane protein n=1 Tax=Mucilaginibacter ginsenosidivorax TaxID=862126 RepID=A0A5B8W9A1_9SPHI|nr:RagB/SusD family nutrient uptake outer membrane protein [Mucilaginibacter ginsenosidivorax]QEC80017.1 RagB/SusD family nutrient uptake outer membrane protein [Mucilaginibacter ginsenosidivorax]
MKSIHKFIIAITVSVGVSITSCQRLDIAPTNIFTPDIIYDSEAGVKSFLATIYQNLPIEDFKYRPDQGFKTGGNDWENFYNSASVTGEEVGPFGGMDIGGGFGYWPYGDIRNVNTLIAELPKHVAKLSQATVNTLLGEAHFLRAYYYFGLAKRYGGIPIITVPQDPGAPVTTLQVHRDKEQAVWDFIGTELDLGYQMMPETSDAGRANRYAAAALKSRAMLYAACVARYGSVNFVDGPARAQGLVGIPADKATAYFQAAYDAAKLLDGHYSLYNANSDKVQNYVDLFLKSGSPENIFIKQYSIATHTAHSWDATMSPRYMTANALSRSYPTLDFVRLWGELPVTNGDGTPKRFDNRAQLMQGLEPRLLATVYFPGATLRGLLFDMQRGIYPSFSGTAAAEVAKQANSRSYILAGDTKTLYQGKQVIGFTGPWTGGDELTRTGFYVRKYVDYNKPQSAVDLNRSEQPWIDLRYGEILLNRAEAAMELGNTADALTSVNLIRNRAGATPYTSIDLNKVRNERRMELAFENQYYWDLKRWRTADVVLDRAHFKGLMPYYVFNENKYIFLAEPELFNREYSFQKQFYYEGIPGGEIGKNPNLLPNNPNY